MWWTFRKENGFHPRSKYGYNQFLLQNRCMMQCHFRVSSLFFCSNTQRSIPPRLGYVALRWCAVSTYLYVHSIGNRSGFTAWYGQTGFVLLPRDFFLRRLVMNSECDFPQSLPFAVMVNCACRWIFFSWIFFSICMYYAGHSWIVLEKYVPIVYLFAVKVSDGSLRRCF